MRGDLEMMGKIGEEGGILKEEMVGVWKR